MPEVISAFSLDGADKVSKTGYIRRPSKLVMAIRDDGMVLIATVGKIDPSKVSELAAAMRKAGALEASGDESQLLGLLEAAPEKP